jgi:hypothetical protein
VAGERGLPQTEVQYVRLMGIGSRFVPTSLRHWNMIDIGLHLSLMRKRFDKSEEIDEARHQQLAGMISYIRAPYSDEETLILDRGEANLASLDVSSSETTREKAKAKVKGATPAIKNTITFKKGDHIGWGKSVAEVHGTKEKVRSASERSVRA